MGTEAVQFDSGLWTGNVINSAHGTAESLIWSVALSPNNRYPSAFGASVRGGLGALQERVYVLHGEWRCADSRISVIEKAGCCSRRFTGQLLVADGELWIQGTVEWASTGDEVVAEREQCADRVRGFHVGMPFVLHKERDDDHLHSSGVWLGSAVPDDALAPFLVPTNPVVWTASIIGASPRCTTPRTTAEQDTGGAASAAGDDGRYTGIDGSFVFGAGLFTDTADIPGQPLLFYTVSGTYDPADGAVSLVKEYEHAEQTEGILVQYEGSLRGGDNGDLEMVGRWSNDKMGTYGRFVAARVDLSRASLHICVCSVCSTIIQPGMPRWTCGDCVSSPPFYCHPCSLSDDAKAHPHSLLPDVAHTAEMAMGESCRELVLDAFERFSGRPMLGQFASAHSGDLRWHTYEDVRKQCAALGDALCRCLGGKSEQLVLVFSAVNELHVVMQLGVLMHQCVLAPVDPSLSAEEVAEIIRSIEPRAAVSGLDELPVLRRALALSGRDIPIMYTQCGREWTSSVGLDQAAPAATYDRANQEQRRAILFSSGSSGTPKGVWFSEDLCLPREAGSVVYPYVRVDFQPWDPTLFLSVLSTLQHGGSRVFARMETLLEDLKVIRPTHIGASPVFWTHLYKRYLRSVAKAQQSQPAAPAWALQEEAAGEIRAQLGNRLILATSGGAGAPSHVLEFVREKLRIDIVSLYGARETGGIARDGVVFAAVDVRLLPIEGSSYDVDGAPPTGEICVSTPRLVEGYVGSQNQASFVELDGKRFYRTGDVGRIRSACEHGVPLERPILLDVIGRCNAAMKLGHGEWISPASIEAELEESPAIHQVCVLGDPSELVPVAVVVPTDTAPCDVVGCVEQPCAQCASKLLREVRFWARHRHMRPKAIPQAVYVERVPFAASNGLLTGTMKKRRKALNKHYDEVKAGLYRQIHDGIANDEQEPLHATLAQLLEEFVPSDRQLDHSASLAESGVNSLTVAALGRELRRHGIECTLAQLYDHSLEHISSLLERVDAGIGVDRAMENETVNFLEEGRLGDLASDQRARASDRERCVLVTGATGYLGPVLVGEVLGHKEFARVICVVRGATDESAHRRLVEQMKAAKVWEDSHAAKLEVLSGSVSKDAFGLQPAVYDALCERVTDVLHNAAFVHMTLPYSALRNPNVGGTLRAIKFAVQSDAQLHFMSSIGALGRSAETTQDGWASVDAESFDSKDGYSQTKAVCEMLLRDAAKKYGLRVRAFRPSAIGPHSVHGHWNDKDFSYLLLKACVHLGCTQAECNMMFRWIPVDFVATATVKLMLLDVAEGCAFTLAGFGPASGMAMEVLDELLPSPLERVELAQWKERANAQLHRDPTLGPLLHLISNVNFGGTSAPIDVTREQEILKERLNLEWPQYSREMCRNGLRVLLGDTDR